MPRLLVARRTIAAFVVLGGLSSIYLNHANNPALPFAQSVTYALLGVVFVIMALEERAKSKQSYPVVFSLLALGMFALAAWVSATALHRL